MKNFIIKILAFLLTMFPSCGTLLAPYQSLTYPGQIVVTDCIMNAIETGDITALEDMISISSKENMEDLPGNLTAIINSIDGEVVEYSSLGTSDYDKSNYGSQISRRSWKIIFNTATEAYRLDVTWIVVNNHEPEEVGMRSMSLSDSEGNLLATTYVPKT